ncbi:hypothetical protein OROHE_003240 [Orobanche hederae]
MPSQEILKIRDGTPLEAEEILTYIKKPSRRIDAPSNVVQKKRVARILFFKIRPSQEILKIRDGITLEAEEILTYIKSPRDGSVWYFSSKLDIPSNLVYKKRVARILFFKIRPSQKILKIRDGTPLEAEEILTYIKSPRDGSVWPSQEILKIRDGITLEAEEILTYIKSPRDGSVWYFSSKLDIPSNLVYKKRVARILFFKIMPSQEILKIRDGTPLEAEEILTYIKKPSRRIDKLDAPSNVVQKKRVARILFFKIRPSQEILKIRDGITLEAEEILTYIKSPRDGSVWYFSSKLDIPSNLVYKKRVARILFFKIMPSQEILKIRDGTPLEAEEILTYIKNPRNGSVCYFSSKLDAPSNVVQKKRVARILFFKIRPSQEILKIRDGTPMEAEEISTYIKKALETDRAEEILTYIKSPRDGSVWPSQEILKIRDGITLEAEEILTYIKSPRDGSVWYFSSKLDIPSNLVYKKRVARILFFKIMPSQEILKIRDGTPLEKKRVARILFFKIRPSQEILKIRDGITLEAEEILTYIKSPRDGSVWYFSSKLDIPSNLVYKKRVARILFFKIMPSQEILKIRDGTPLEAEEILTYIKNPRNGSVCYFSSKLDAPSNVVQKKRVARILFFKIRPSQEILKIRDGTPMEAEEISTYIKKALETDRPSQKILKIRDGTPLEAEEILTYIKSPRDGSKKRVAQILFFKIRPSQEILKIRDGITLEAEEILTYIKSPRDGSVWYFSSKLDIPSNLVYKKRVARILFFKIMPSQEILKIRDGTPLEAEEILTYIKNPRNGSVCYFSSKLDAPSNVVQKKRVARILFFKIRPSQEILKIRDGITLEAKEILTYIKSPRDGSVWYFSSKLDIPSNLVYKKRVARILFFKIMPSQEILKFVMKILKIRDGTPLEKKRVARILFFKIRPSQEILKIRDGITLEAEEILTYIKSPRDGSVWYFSSKLDIPSNLVYKKRVARILFFKIRPSQKILKIRDGTPLEAEEILTYIKSPRDGSVWPSQEILKIRDGITLEAEEILTYIKSPRDGSVWYFSSKLDIPSNLVYKKRVARILFFKIMPSQEILKIRDGTPLEAEEILTYIKKPSRRIDAPSNVVQKKRVARILFFKIRPSQEILKIRDGITLEAEEILTYIKSPRDGSVWYFSSKLDIPSNLVYKKRVARILFFKIMPSQEILKIRDGTPLEAEEILTYIKNPRNGSVCYFSSKLDAPSNVVQKKRVARILFFKIRPSQEILKIRDGTPMEAEEISTYIKKALETDRPSQKILKIRDGTPLEKKRVARILFFKIRPSQEILKIRDGITLEAEEILTYIKSPRDGSVWYFSSKLDIPSNLVYKKRVARILFFKIMPSQEILKIRDGTPLEAEEILTYIKKPSRRIDKLDAPSNVVQKKRVARILFFKIRPSQEILKIRDGITLEAEEILTYIKNPRDGSVWYFSSKLDIPSNLVYKKRVARILFFKIMPSQEILKIRDGTPLEAEEILTYIKNPRNGSVCYFSSKLDAPSNVVQKKRVARILFFKIRPSQEILKIRDGTPMEAEEISTYIKKALETDRAEEILTYIKSPRDGSLDAPSNVVQKKRVAQILFFKIRPSQEILKIRDGITLEAEEILTYIKSPRDGSVWYFSSKLDIPSNLVYKKRVARILFFKIMPSQEILKIRDGTPLEAEEILTYIKNPRNGSVCYFSSKLDAPSNVVQKKRVARILFFKIRPSQEILKIRDGITLEAKEILTYIKSPRDGSVWYFSSKLDIPSNLVYKKRVARILFFKIMPSQEILKFVMMAWILFFKIRPSQEILKIRDGTPLEVEEILTYPRNGSVFYFSSKLDALSNVVQKKKVARIMFFKIMPSQEILKIRDGSTPLEKKRVARILFFKIRPSQEILKIRDGTPLEAEEILTYIKSPRDESVWYFSSKLDIPSNLVYKKRVAQILFFKIMPSQEILKIRDGTPLEAEEILTYIKNPRNGSVCYFSSKLDAPMKKRVAWILFFKIRPSQEILKIRDGTPLEAEEILTYIKSPRDGSVWYFSSKLDIPSNLVYKKRVAQILFFKIRPSQEILKIRDGTPLEAEEILTYIKNPRNGLVCYFSSKLDAPSNVVQKKRVARILFFKIRPSPKILKIRDGTPLEVEGILTYITKPSRLIEPSQEILKIRDGTPLEAEEILTYIKRPRDGSVWYFSSKLDIPSNLVYKKRVAQILFFKIMPSQEILKIRDGTPLEMPSQEILKIRDGTPLEAEEILTYIKSPRDGSVWYFSSKLDIPSNLVYKKRVAQILFFKIRPSQEILKIRDGTPLEAEEILTYIKNPRNGLVCYFSSKLDAPSNVVQKKRVARILFFKIRPSPKILKIRDGTPLEVEGILTYITKPSRLIEILKIRDGTPLEKKRVAWILFFKIRPSQEILKIRDGTPLEAEEILTYIKRPRDGSVWYFSSKLDIPSNLVYKKRVAQILFFKIMPSQEILKIRDGTPLEAEEILTYIKNPRNGSVCYFSSKLDAPSNVVQKKRVARILFFKIRPSPKILKIRDGTPLEVEGILTYITKPSRLIEPSQEILKIRDGTPLEAEEILTYVKKALETDRPSQEILKIRDGTPLEAEEILTYVKKALETDRKKRVARILFFKIRPSREILKIRDGTPLEVEEILTYPRNGSVFYFSSKLDALSNVVQKKKVARIMFFKIMPSQEILKIRDGTPLEAEEILSYVKKALETDRVARILFFKIRPSQEILKIRDGTPLEAEEILTYIKSPRDGSVWYFSSKLDIPSNLVYKKRVAQILFFKIMPSQEIFKIRDGTPLEAEEILTYIKTLETDRKIDAPSNVVQKKRVARILFFKIRPSQEILKIRDGTPLEAEEILTYIKSPRDGSVWYFSSKLDIPSNLVYKKRVAQILFFKIMPSQEILKIRDGTPLEAEEILTYIKTLETDRPSQEILKIRDGTPLEAEEILTYVKKALETDRNVVQKKRVARILFFKIRPSQEILKIRDGTPLEAEEILTYIKSPRDGSVWYFSSKLDIPSNLVYKKRVAQILFFKIMPSQEILKIRDGTPLEAEEILTYIKTLETDRKRVARILFFKIRPSQEILKIRDGTPLEAEEILTYIKSPRDGSVWYFSSKLDIPSNLVYKKRVAQILFFKIMPSQEILKIRDGTPLEAEEILTYIKTLETDRNVVQKKRVARILFFKIRPSREILKIRDGTPLEVEEILTYPRNGSVFYFSSKLDALSNVVQKKKVARIMFFKIMPSQEILKIRDGTPLEAEEILSYVKKALETDRVARILFFKIRPSQEILKIRDGTPLEAEEILTYIKSPRDGSVWYFSSKLDIPSNLVYKKRVAQILFFKIMPSQEILKIRDGTPLEAEEILTYIKTLETDRKIDAPSNVVQKKRVARILFFKIRPSQEILKIRDGTPLEAEEILTYIKSPRDGSVWYFSSKLDIPSNLVYKKRVAQILFFKIMPSQEILKIRDGTPLEAEEILTYIKTLETDRPSQEILKIRDGTPLEAEEILTYVKKALETDRKIDAPSNVVQKKRVARILFFKIRPSQEILKIRDGTPLEAEEILTYIKSPRDGSVWYFSSKLDIPSNLVYKKRVAQILFFKIMPSQEILKIRDGTPLEAEEILTYIKTLETDRNVVQKKRVARILFFKIRPSQEILKIRDGTPLEAEEILTYIKSPRDGSVWYFSSKLDIPSNLVYKKRVAQILFFKIMPSQEILKIRDGTPLEAEEILTYIKTLETDRKLDAPSNVVQKKRVARILFFKIRPSREILKIRDGTPLEVEEILTYPRNGSVFYFSSKLDALSNVVQKRKVARIMFFKIMPSQEILKIRDGTPLEAEEILTYVKKALETDRVARILFFKIRPSQEILKIRDGTPLEAEEILTYIKSPRDGSVWYFSSKLDIPSNLVYKKRVAQILFFKIMPSQEILKIRDGTPLEAEEILTYIKTLETDRPSQEILKIRDGTPLEAEEILTYVKKALETDRPSQEILKIRDGTPMEAEEISTYIKKALETDRPSQEILKIRDGTPMEADEISTYIKKALETDRGGGNFDIHKKSPRNGSVCYFSSKLNGPSNVVQTKRVAQILFFKIRPSQEILKIRDGTPLVAEEILTYIKSPRDGSVWYFSSKLDIPSNLVYKKRVARIFFFKIMPSQEILKIRDGTPLEAEEILTYIKKPSKRIGLLLF